MPNKMFQARNVHCLLRNCYSYLYLYVSIVSFQSALILFIFISIFHLQIFAT